jgi:hypothetical protein
MSQTLGTSSSQSVRHFPPTPQASGDAHAADRERPSFTLSLETADALFTEGNKGTKRRASAGNTPSTRFNRQVCAPELVCKPKLLIFRYLR